MIRELTSLHEVARLPEPVIMNCTGLGARELFDDEELTPVKGQLSVLLPQPEIDYAYAVGSEDERLYMFPRRDGILLGGTAESGNWSLEPNKQEQRRILEGRAAIAAAIRR